MVRLHSRWPPALPADARPCADFTPHLAGAPRQGKPSAARPRRTARSPFGVVDHAELIAVRVTYDDEVRTVRIRPFIHTCRAQRDQPLDMAALLARVEVQVHSDGFLRRPVGQLEGNRELPSGG